MEKIRLYIKQKPGQALAIFAVVLIAAALLAGLLSRPAQVNDQVDSDDDQQDGQVDERTATVFSLEETTVTLRDGDSGRLVQVDGNQSAAPGSVAATSAGAYALVMLEDGGTLLLKPQSEARIYPDPQSSGFELLSGTGWYRAAATSVYRAEFASLQSDEGSVTVEAVSEGEVFVLVQTGEYDLSVFESETEIASLMLEEFDEVTLQSSAFNDYEGGALSRYVTAADQLALEQDEWFRFTTCVDAYLASLLADDPQPSPSVVEEGMQTCSSIVISPDDAGEDTEVTIEEVTAAFTSSTTLMCSWESSASDIQGYAYWIGTAPGQKDVKEETFIEDASASYTFTPAEGKTYYCTVRVITADGTGEKSSGGAIPLTEDAELNVREPDSGDRFDGEITGMVETDLDAADIFVRASLKAPDSKYLGTSGWQSPKHYFSLDLNDDLDFSGDLQIENGYDNATLVIEVVLTGSSEVLDQVTVQVDLD
ncbi:MAG: hypothetical protein TR69_WS6001000267 [candidate division WS6 bacterium OLB20]|uniref:Fibronectin type-III domain-containing protein n=1 Tax=candidate division WS6 bacterium OLB20 TaxID=1617426 RepID=A0A136M0G3_9BACT|nr:MAG: hypothetical protein TR69_WS6001000267 [candidate division WS6 bacterium OLB20]